MVDFRAIIDNLHEIHFYDAILPFLLVYVIVFAVLEKSKIFSTKEGDREAKHVKNVNAIIAFVFALFVVASIQTVIYIQMFLTQIVLFLIFILGVLIVLGFIFGDDYKKLFLKDGKVEGWVSWTIGIVVFLVALWILFTIMGVWDSLLYWWDNISGGTDFATILIFIILITILFWITKGSSNGGKNNSG